MDFWSNLTIALIGLLTAVFTSLHLNRRRAQMNGHAPTSPAAGGTALNGWTKMLVDALEQFQAEKVARQALEVRCADLSGRLDACEKRRTGGSTTTKKAPVHHRSPATTTPPRKKA